MSLGFLGLQLEIGAIRLHLLHLFKLWLLNNLSSSQADMRHPPSSLSLYDHASKSYEVWFLSCVRVPRFFNLACSYLFLILLCCLVFVRGVEKKKNYTFGFWRWRIDGEGGAWMAGDGGKRDAARFAWKPWYLVFCPLDCWFNDDV